MIKSFRDFLLSAAITSRSLDRSAGIRYVAFLVLNFQFFLSVFNGITYGVQTKLDN